MLKIQSLTDKIEDIRAQVRAIENASDLQERAVRVEYQRNRNLKEKLHQVSACKIEEFWPGELKFEYIRSKSAMKNTRKGLSL
mmetsp:Transcript_21843/g.35172  ORF Transcript_21843/g.35172 Transcript_21843/m.35172 type:complete len:83 (+) Transcript_21843:456-704(+)